MRNFSTRRRASSVQPAHTRQKSRIDATYSRPGMTRLNEWASTGSEVMPRASNARLRIGNATNSVVPGATVVSMSTRQCGWIFSPMVRSVSSSAPISTSPVRRFPSDSFL